jgi:hypothetical protein
VMASRLPNAGCGADGVRRGGLRRTWSRRRRRAGLRAGHQVLAWVAANRSYGREKLLALRTTWRLEERQFPCPPIHGSTELLVGGGHSGPPSGCDETAQTDKEHSGQARKCSEQGSSVELQMENPLEGVQHEGAGPDRLDCEEGPRVGVVPVQFGCAGDLLEEAVQVPIGLQGEQLGIVAAEPLDCVEVLPEDAAPDLRGDVRARGFADENVPPHERQEGEAWRPTRLEFGIAVEMAIGTLVPGILTKSEVHATFGRIFSGMTRDETERYRQATRVCEEGAKFVARVKKKVCFITFFDCVRLARTCGRHHRFLAAGIAHSRARELASQIQRARPE